MSTVVALRPEHKIRALLIDAEKRSISEIEIAITGAPEIDKARFGALLHCDAIAVTVMSWVDDTDIDGWCVDDLVLAKDGGLPDDSEPHGWFQVDHWDPIADYGLVVGCYRDRRYSAEISVEELRPRVTFSKRRIVYGPVDANGVGTYEEIIEN